MLRSDQAGGVPSIRARIVGGDAGGGLVRGNGCCDAGCVRGVRIAYMGMRIAFTVVVMFGRGSAIGDVGSNNIVKSEE